MLFDNIDIVRGEGSGAQVEQILENLSRAALDHAIEENQRRLFQQFMQHWPGAVCDSRPGLTHFRSDGSSPLFSAVQSLTETVPDLDALIRELQDEHERHASPLGWLVWPTSSPAPLSERLRQHGFVHALDMVGMAVDLSELQVQPVPPGITITEAQTAAEFARWMEPCRIAFEFSDADRAGYESGLLGLGFGGDSPVHHYIAYDGERPVACSSLYLDAGVAGIYNVATLPEARGRGIGAAITQQPLLVARAMGYRAGILHATPMGAPVYRRLGFRDHYQIGFFAWGAAGH